MSDSTDRRDEDFPGSRSETLREIAASWHEALGREEVTDQTRAAFEKWRGNARENAEAYDAVDRAWAAARSAADDSLVLALRHEAALRLTRGLATRPSAPMAPGGWARRGWSARRTAAAIAAVAIIGMGLFVAAPREFAQLAELAGFGRERGNQRFATQVGERLAVDLPDGSRVTLNTQTELDTAYSGTERQIVLARGQALFEVAKESARPFVVVAQGQRFVAVGTAFDVRVDGGRVQVTMLEGFVNVERVVEAKENPTPAGAATSPSYGMTGKLGDEWTAPGRVARDPKHDTAIPSRRALIATIAAGEQLTVEAERVNRVRLADSERVTSWRRGQVIFENARLADAIAEINRYSDAQIALVTGNPALAELRLSGAFATGRTTVFVEAVTTYFPLRIVRADDRVIVLGLSSQSGRKDEGSGFSE